MGTRIHAGGQTIDASTYKNWLQRGAIGPVREVHVWCAKLYGVGDNRRKCPPVPKGLHYDFRLLFFFGCAPYRTIISGCTYISNWRSCGIRRRHPQRYGLDNYTDLPFWALEVAPSDYCGRGRVEGAQPDSAANWLIVHYEFPSAMACRR